MAYYNGKIQRNLLVDKIVTLLTTAPVGSSEPYWKKVNSGSFVLDGFILQSSGKTGSNEIFVKINNTTATNAMVFTTMENYIPNPTAGLAGTVTGETAAANLYFHPSVYGETFPVEYFLSFDRDKIILALKGDPAVNGTTNLGMVWIGMPQRLDPDNDRTNNAVAIACSKNANGLGTSAAAGGICRIVKDRSGEANALTTMITTGAATGRSKGWGGEIVLPTIYLEDSNGVEGIRSIMDGIHPIYQDAAAQDFKNGDEIIKNSKRYIVLQIGSDGINNTYVAPNCFPSVWMAIEQLL